MDNIRQDSPLGWEWTDQAGRNFGVRVFPKTQTIIWSSWQNTADGPQFNPGVKHTYTAFLAGEDTPFPVPEEVLTSLREVMSQTGKQGAKRKWFGRR